MPSPVYAALAAKAARAADAITAEGWTLQPMKAVLDRNAAAVPDPSRAAVPVLATFTDREARPDANQYDPKAQHRPGVVAGSPVIIVSPAARADAALAAATVAAAGGPAGPFVIGQGDRLVRDADGRPWTIARAFAMPAGSLRLSVDLSS